MTALSSQRHMSKGIFHLLLFSTVIALIGGGVALLLQPHAASQAGGVSVVGPPSLAASTVNAIFTRLGSPMAGTGDIVVRASRNTQIDDAFALAVWWTETNDGEAGTGRAYGDRNPAGVRASIGYPSDFAGYTIYPSYSAAIVYWFGMIRNRYVNRGMDTVYAISHPYVGTSSSPLWAAKVIRLMLQYRGEAPPPTAIPTVQPSPTVKPSPIVSPVVPGLNKKPIRQPEVDVRAFTKNNQVRPHGVQVSSVPQDAGYTRWIELSIIFFALLAATIVAIWATRTMRLRRIVPEPMPLRVTTSLLPLAVTERTQVTRLYHNEVFGVRTTEALRVDIVGAGLAPALEVDVVGAGLAPVLDLDIVGVGFRHSVSTSVLHSHDSPGSLRETDPRLRRVTLLPSQPGKTPVTREAVTVGARPMGLLSRYREMQQR